MRVIVWVAEGTWPGCVDAAAALAPADAEIVLLHVAAADIPGAASGAYAGLLGRGRPERDPGARLAELADSAAEGLLASAASRLGRPSTQQRRHGRPEREVIAAADGAGLLVLARDGDRSRLGPRSLGPESRFVVDHAPCPVLLAWPEGAPEAGTVPGPPGPGRPGRRPPPPPGREPPPGPGREPPRGPRHRPPRTWY